MAPKKRATSSKKPPPSQPSQPAKFGILHFFERQTQTSQDTKRQKPGPPLPSSAIRSGNSDELLCLVCRVLSAVQLIKQSQDDSRLRSMKSRQFLGAALNPCSENEKNPSLEAMKKWHSSPLGLSRCTASGRNSCVSGSGPVGCDSLDDNQSPFRTPPSLSYGCSEQLNNGVTSVGGPEQLGAGQHKKALLDLLDQVEDAIMEEELPLVSANKGGQTTNQDNTMLSSC